jgi:hypothetical protein
VCLVICRCRCSLQRCRRLLSSSSCRRCLRIAVACRIRCYVAVLVARSSVGALSPFVVVPMLPSLHCRRSSSCTLLVASLLLYSLLFRRRSLSCSSQHRRCLRRFIAVVFALQHCHCLRRSSSSALLQPLLASRLFFAVNAVVLASVIAVSSLLRGLVSPLSSLSLLRLRQHLTS